MEFEVTILGSNSAIPAHGRNQTSQLVSVGNSFLLLDCGEGTQIQLRKYKLKFGKIDFIFISHLHGDHFYGLMGLISSFHLVKRERLLTLFGPPGLDEIITTQLKYTDTKLSFELRFVATQSLEKRLILEEPLFRVYSFPLQHRIPCTGFLIEEKHGLRNMIKEKLISSKVPVKAIVELRKGKDYQDEDNNTIYKASDYTYPPKPNKKYGYCSDTIFDPNLVAYLQGVDLLYHESTFGDEEQARAKMTFHSTARQAATIAKLANSKKLLLGHYSSRYKDLTPILEQAKEVFENSLLSLEGNTYEV